LHGRGRRDTPPAHPHHQTNDPIFTQHAGFQNMQTTIAAHAGLSEDDLFVCPDRERTGFVPSER
jgi:hypothetical protein